jgi:hypothetical protein
MVIIFTVFELLARRSITVDAVICENEFTYESSPYIAPDHINHGFLLLSAN